MQNNSLITRLRSLFKNNLFRFVFTFAALFIFYKYIFTAYVYDTMLGGPWWDFQIFTLDLLTSHSAFLMKLFGIGVKIVESRYMLLENSVGNIRIDQPCLAIDLMFMFAFLIISYPSSYKLKAIFGIGGIIAIHFLNVLRVTGVAIVLVKYPNRVWPLVDRHHLIFDTSVYILIFLMFVLFTWLSNKYLKAKAEQQQV